jgi:sarcosine oxidase subunit beta
MSKHAQVVIIGAGLVGVSIAYHLAIRGCTDVLILEKQSRESSGSTARSLAGIWHQFHRPVNVQLSLYSNKRLIDFTREIGIAPGLHQTGSLFLIDDPLTWEHYLEDAAMQQALGARVEVLTPAEAAYLLPHLHTDDLIGATYSPDGGYCDPRSVALGYLQRALELGVRLRFRSAVVGFDIQHEQVCAVHTQSSTISCDVVVNAAGPWAGEVAAYAGLELPVRPYRRATYTISPCVQIPDAMPLVVDVGSGLCLRKDSDNLFLGQSAASDQGADDLQAESDEGYLDAVLAAAQRRMPVLQQAELAAGYRCVGLDEMTPDANPVIGRHPDLIGYVDANGFSGHGVMHAPATGMLVAEEILDGRAHTINIDDLRIGRFVPVLRQKERGAVWQPGVA